MNTKKFFVVVMVLVATIFVVSLAPAFAQVDTVKITVISPNGGECWESG